MNILFISIGGKFDFNTHGIYTDLLREFLKDNHNIYIACANQNSSEQTYVEKNDNISILRVSTGKLTKTNIIKKGIATLMAEPQFKNAIKKHFSDVTFDLAIYTTPPITFYMSVKYIKKRDNAKTYLLLKDIFPQNAVDIGMMSKSGVKGFLYRYFRKKEKKLYAISDRIGCMSQAKVDYVLKQNPEVSADKVEICPNAIEIQDLSISEEQKVEIRQKYNIPLDKKIFIYGGNLGRPQGIPFIIECLKTQINNPDAYFLIVGDGTEYRKLEAFFNSVDASNMKLMKRLPKEDYDRMVAACDVGMIFLDHRFTIPNFPSRLLAYMQAQIPVLACTDPNTDIGEVITKGGFGWWCESNDTEAFMNCISSALSSDLNSMKQTEMDYLKSHYTSEICYKTIVK